MRANRLLERVHAHEPALGCLLAIGDSFSAETLAACGFDWLAVDLQHGMLGIDRCIAMLQALEGTAATPTVRVPGPDPALVGKVLDAGALGVVLPSVEDAETARRFVAACRYPPSGTRSVGPSRPRLTSDDWAAEAEHGVARIVMVESPRALDDVEQIAAVDGLHGVLLGTADLSRATGIPVSDPRFAAFFERVAAACRERGVAAGAFVETAESVRRARALGFSLFVLGVDAHLLEAGARARLEDARAALE